MESDIEALGGLFAKVVSEIQRLTTPPEVMIERVRVSEFFSGLLSRRTKSKKRWPGCKTTCSNCSKKASRS